MKTKGRREAWRSKSVGQGEDDTPEGWTFLNFASFVGQNFYFVRESESEDPTKVSCKLVFW